MSQSPRLSPIAAVLALALVAAVGCGAEDPRDVPPPYREGLNTPEDLGFEGDGEGVAPDAMDAGPPSPEEPPPEEPPPEEPPPEEPPPEEPPPEEPPSVPANCPQVRVTGTGGATLNVRPDPSTDHPVVGSLAAGEVVDVVDVVEDGETINGTATWYEIDAGSLTGFVSGAFTSCVDPNAPAPTFPASKFLLPLACGAHKKVTQGNSSSFSHNGGSKYAFDFGLALNTPMLAMKAGTVVSVRFITHPGDPCYSGGGENCIDKANTVTIDHGDGSNTLYAHVNSVDVSQGQQVERGDVVAHSGSTGYSTGPHAHVQRQNDCGSWWCQSIQMKFADFDEADNIPETGDWVTSQNGCD